MAEIPRSTLPAKSLGASLGKFATGGGTGAGLKEIGSAISGIARERQKALDREADREELLADANMLIETTTGAGRLVAEEFDRRAREGDPADPKFTVDLEKFLDRELDRVRSEIPRLPNGRPAVSEEALVKRDARLETLKLSAIKQSLRLQNAAMKAKAVDALGEMQNDLAADLRRDPHRLPVALMAAEKAIDDYAGALNAEGLREFKSKPRQTLLAAQVRGFIDRSDLAGPRAVLADETFDKDLTPGQRDTLTGEIAIEERRRETRREADRREAEIELREQVADAAFVLARGKTPPGLDTLREAAKAIPELAQVIEDAVGDAQIMNDFVHLPPLAQAARIGELDDRTTLDRREVVRLTNMRRVQAGALKALKQDPLAYAVEIDVLPELAAIDFGDPKTLARRQVQAQGAAAFFQIPISPLRPVEVEALTKAIDQAEGDQVAALFQSLTFGFGRDALGRIAGRIAPDRPAIAVALSRAEASPVVASTIVRGDRLARENTEVKPSPEEIEPLVAEVYGNLFREVPSALQLHKQAAIAIYAVGKVPTGDFAFDDDLFETALVLAAGGRIDADGKLVGGPIEFNDQLVLPPAPGMDEDAFADLVETLTPEELERFGNGAPVFADDGGAFTAEAFDTGFFGFSDAAQLTTIADGVYLIRVPPNGKYVITPDGEPYHIDLGRVLRARGGAP